jgi:hypothetical protein
VCWMNFAETTYAGNHSEKFHNTLLIKAPIIEKSITNPDGMLKHRDRKLTAPSMELHGKN